MTTDMIEQLQEHAETCDEGWRNCADCRLIRDTEALTAIGIAQQEHAAIAPWRQRHKRTCVYCGDDAEHRDHLVPEPWTGPIARQWVPTVPACADCNVRIGAALVHTIAGRAEVVANSLRRKYRKDLLIPDREPDFYDGMSDRMAANLQASQWRRQLLRYRLMVLEGGGAAQYKLDDDTEAVA